MKILGRNFVFGRTIDEALQRAKPERRKGPQPQLRHAWRGGEDLRGRRALCRCLPRGARPDRQGGEGRLPPVARHLGQADRASSAVRIYASRTKRSRRSFPVVRELALKAAKADVHFTIDAEEADRLELQMDVFEALLADDELFANGWGGFGIAIQAYQKRAAPLCDWVVEAARAHGRKLMCRLVKGAYWDTEIKAAQVGGPSRLSRVHAQGRDRRFLSRLRPQAAGRQRRHLSGIRDPQCQHDRPGEGARRRSRVRVPAPPRNGRGALRRARRAGAARRRRADAGAHLRARRQPQGTARLSRAAPAGERRQFELRQPHRRRAGLDRRAGPRSGGRARGARAQAQSEDRPPARRVRSRSAATAPGSTSAIRWCASRCSSG